MNGAHPKRNTAGHSLRIHRSLAPFGKKQTTERESCYQCATGAWIIFHSILSSNTIRNPAGPGILRRDARDGERMTTVRRSKPSAPTDGADMDGRLVDDGDVKKKAAAPANMTTLRKLGLCGMLVAMQCIFDLLVEVVKVCTTAGPGYWNNFADAPSIGRCLPGTTGEKSRSRFQQSR